MMNRFCRELAKLFFAVSAIFILVIGLLSQVPLKTVLIRLLFGGGISAILGYLFGMVIDRQNQKQLIEREKQKYKIKMKDRYQESQKKIEKEQSLGEFAPMEVEQLAKIVVDSLKD